MSILDTQHRVDRAKEQVAIAKEVLAMVNRKLEDAIDAHHEQIRRSLASNDPRERQMAESVANWWEVPKPSISSPSLS